MLLFFRFFFFSKYRIVNFKLIVLRWRVVWFVEDLNNSSEISLWKINEPGSPNGSTDTDYRHSERSSSLFYWIIKDELNPPDAELLKRIDITMWTPQSTLKHEIEVFILANQSFSTPTGTHNYFAVEISKMAVLAGAGKQNGS